MKLKEGHGYWSIEHYPIGGDFKRAKKGGLELKDALEFLTPKVGGCNVIGYTHDNKRIAFTYDHLEDS